MNEFLRNILCYSISMTFNGTLVNGYLKKNTYHFYLTSNLYTHTCSYVSPGFNKVFGKFG